MGPEDFVNAFAQVANQLDTLARKCAERNLADIFTDIERLENEVDGIIASIPGIITPEEEEQLIELLRCNKDGIRDLRDSYLIAIGEDKDSEVEVTSEEEVSDEENEAAQEIEDSKTK